MILELNFRQRKALELLNARRDRDIYEGGGPDGRRGSGRFWVTYSGGERYEPLTWSDVRNMQAAGLIMERYPGCYVLPGAPPEPVRKTARR
jgi:hypothetical protein